MPPVAIIAGGAALAAGGLAGSYMAGRSQAKSQGDAAKAQLTKAEETRRLAEELSAPTSEEISALERQARTRDRTLALQEAELDRSRRMLEAIDPGLIEAGRQAYELLQGKEARTLDPLRNQRDRQRQQLVSRLRAQLGPGFETSTAGIQALTRFDEDTANVLAGAQEQSTQNLLGLSLRSRPDLFGQVNQSGQLLFNMDQSLREQRGSLANRRLAAILQTPLTPYAGANYVTSMGNSQAFGNLMGGVSQIGGQLLGAGLSANMPTSPAGGAAAGANQYSLGSSTNLGSPAF